MTDTSPIPEPLNTFTLDVGDGHSIYVEECGNPNGIPLITFHGGPGSYSKPKHRLRYDLTKYHLFLFDQRCGGQSRPLAVDDRAAMKYFTPAAIVADAERIRQHVGIDSWNVTGASWGSTMALLYATTYPAATRSLVLRALFLSQESSWGWMATGAEMMAPPGFAAAQKLAPGKTGNDLMQALCQQILDGDDAQSFAVTNAIFGMEHGLEVVSEPEDPSVPPAPPKDDRDIINNGLLYAHVIRRHLLPEGWAFTPAAQTALRGKPMAIVHGACDVGCPLKDVYALAAAHPHAELHIARNAGHGVDLDGESQRFYNVALDRLTV